MDPMDPMDPMDSDETVEGVECVGWPVSGRCWPAFGRSWPVFGRPWPRSGRSWPVFGHSGTCGMREGCGFWPGFWVEFLFCDVGPRRIWMTCGMFQTCVSVVCISTVHVCPLFSRLGATRRPRRRIEVRIALVSGFKSKVTRLRQPLPCSACLKFGRLFCWRRLNVQR
jgi:hypothetical protein